MKLYVSKIIDSQAILYTEFKYRTKSEIIIYHLYRAYQYKRKKRPSRNVIIGFLFALNVGFSDVFTIFFTPA